MRLFLPLRLFPALLIVALAALCFACASNDCDGNKNSLPLAQFMSSDSVPQKVSIDSISIYGIGAPGDSLLLDSAANVSSTYLPFRIDQNSTSFVFQYLQSVIGQEDIRDTITFRYDIVPHFVSAACGAVYDFNNIDISHTSHFIDSISCPDGRISNANITNIFIYFRISDAPLQ